ncbi:MAG TPA: hypothetical protein VLK33_21660 [Terriglobales bacterium]|nr:hypothetical protein [Terriglobales bacterium]
MSTVLILLFVMLAVLFVLRQVKGRTQGIKSPEDLRTQLRPVDIDAFRNLTDPQEKEFLQSHLSSRDYRKVQRQRLQATLSYVSCVADNAAVLIKMGEDARKSSDPSIADAGTALVNNALRLRLQTFQVKAKVYAQIIYPSMPTPSGELVSQYEQMTRQGILLGRLQYPARGISGAF